ncbi:hypothetical protein Mal52_30590 [Symmachiella dynata]|uniref:Uncharacterized protein n=1 Tax=Symmachiella dynata TaxID=2527995 RepID=A0A517ZQ11_9PLAN|nr:hypothetical protein Mal52_30590 [Symmachiella dynata]
MSNSAQEDNECDTNGTSNNSTYDYLNLQIHAVRAKITPLYKTSRNDGFNTAAALITKP